MLTFILGLRLTKNLNQVTVYWSAMVVLNAIFPFLISLGFLTTLPKLIGVLMAIATFTLLYASLDWWLLNKGKSVLSSRLRLGAFIKIFTFILPFIDLIIGAISVGATRILIGVNLESERHQKALDSYYLQSALECLATYLTTMIDGLLLSAIVGVLMLLITLISQKSYLRVKRRV